MFCSKCGSQNDDSSVFCRSCGERFAQNPLPIPAQDSVSAKDISSSSPGKPLNTEPKKKKRLFKILIPIMVAVILLGGSGTIFALYLCGEIGFPINSYLSISYEEYESQEITRIYFRDYRGLSSLTGYMYCEIDLDNPSRQKAIMNNYHSESDHDMYLYPDLFKGAEYITIRASEKKPESGYIPPNIGGYITEVRYEFKLNRKAEKGGQYDGCYRLEIAPVKNYYPNSSYTTPKNENYFAVLYVKELVNGKTVIYRDGYLSKIIF